MASATTVHLVPDYTDWGRRVREAREAKGWKQSDLAERVGLSQQAISFVERGVVRPTDETREAIAAALDRRAEELFPYGEPAATS
jgi:transcriptional regulator with XRE-family HTH domain